MTDESEREKKAAQTREKYGDIIDLEHFTHPTHPRMSRASRAAQFSPFAALSGYEDLIEEAAARAGEPDPRCGETEEAPEK